MNKKQQGVYFETFIPHREREATEECVRRRKKDLVVEPSAEI